MAKKVFPSQTETDTPSAQPVDETPVRMPIKQMTGHGSAEEMAAELPTNTMLAESIPGEDGDGKPKRKRRTKAEMEAARGSSPVPASDDPLLMDPQYLKYMKEFQAFGGAGMVKGAFNVGSPALGASPLDKKEEDKLDGFFYCASKRFNFGDPFKNWFTASLLFMGLLSSFIVTRVFEVKGNEIQEHIARLFGKKEDEEKESE